MLAGALESELARTTMVVAAQSAPATTPSASPSRVLAWAEVAAMPSTKASAMPQNASTTPSHWPRRRCSPGTKRCRPSAVKIGAV
ncbi:hypothetical protein D3C87_1477590 [compost metagenome]